MYYYSQIEVFQVKIEYPISDGRMRLLLMRCLNGDVHYYCDKYQKYFQSGVMSHTHTFFFDFLHVKHCLALCYISLNLLNIQEIYW